MRVKTTSRRPRTGLLRELALAASATAACALLTGCFDANRPVAYPFEISGLEDQELSGELISMYGAGTLRLYRIVRPPAHGRVVVDQLNARVTYIPDPNFNGTDTFTYGAIGRSGISSPATVTIHILNVNDAPTLAAIPRLGNSAVELLTRQELRFNDIDGDDLNVTVSGVDPDIAQAAYDAATKSLVIEPRALGRTPIVVEVSDGKASARRVTEFEVRDVTRTTRLAGLEPGEAFVLENDSDRAVDFRFLHNQFGPFASDAEVVEHVRGMPLEYATEPFERVLWRFVRDNTFHGPPLSADKWHDDTWVVIDSTGWGYCGNVAAVYVRLARAAGYDARVWGLSGHVIPEIRIGDQWQVYDPDLAVYYYTHDGRIAGLADLVADPTLITDPARPVLDPVEQPFPYSSVVADIYASNDDNYHADPNFMIDAAAPRRLPLLPPGASFTYPGNWTPSPLVYSETQPTMNTFLQGNLSLPPGWNGHVPTPWLLADIRGEGTVRLGDQLYVIGSRELATALSRDQRHYDEVEIVDSTSAIELIMFMNAIRYEVEPENTIAITGKDVWAVKVRTAKLPASGQLKGASAKLLLRPRAINY
jgi:hypothetical protein